ncbi:MAG TPA: RidA family protein [Acidimicrobiales bacterium]|nr:RidA family protein [Acidimicrobiales bacterium]
MSDGGADRRLELAAGSPDAESDAPSTISPCRQSGQHLFVSGQVARRDGKLVAEGRVGDEVDLETARRCARQCALNLLEATRQHLGSLGTVRSVLSLTVYVASAPGFTQQHLVADAASSLLAEVVGAEPPVRAALGMAALPINSPVEAQAIFELAGPPGA